MADTRSYIPDLTALPTAPSGSQFRKAYGGSLPYPGKCTGCGSSYRDCLDLNFQFDQDNIPRDRIGAVLLCVLCFRNAADVMGYVPEATMNKRVEEAKGLQQELRIAHLESLINAMVTELTDRVASYADLGRNILAGDINSVGLPEIEMDLEPAASNGQEREDVNSSGTGIEEVPGYAEEDNTGEEEEEITEQFKSNQAGISLSSTNFGSIIRQDAGTSSNEGSASVPTDTGEFGIPGLSEILGRPVPHEL